MIERLRLALDRIGLPTWFVAIDVLWIVRPETFAIDARHYQAAATEWLAGGNPYSVTVGGIPYLSGPHTLLFYAPTSLISPVVSEGLWMGLGVACSIWLVRRLGLPLWWLLFPPLTHSMWNGNPQTISLALLVAGTSLAAAAAVAIKLYTGLVLVFRPRQAVIAGVILLLTMPFVPWQAYLAQGDAIGSHLQTAWNGSAWRAPVLIPFVVAALWVLRRRGAEWYAVPALFPATQFYYVAMALPAIGKNRLLAAALALPVVLMVPVVVIILAALQLRDTRFTQVRLPWEHPRGEVQQG